MELDLLTAISPIDGRYRGKTDALAAYFSEFALIKYRIYKENHAHTKLYVCSRYPACDAYVRVHEGTNKPVGSLADHRLRKLRKEAHDSFNKLYLTGAMTKDQAYAWLADMIQGPRSQAHIGYLREYYCEQVIQQSKAILANRKEAQQAVSQTRRQLRGVNRYDALC